MSACSNFANTQAFAICYQEAVSKNTPSDLFKAHPHECFDITENHEWVTQSLQNSCCSHRAGIPICAQEAVKTVFAHLASAQR